MIIIKLLTELLYFAKLIRNINTSNSLKIKEKKIVPNNLLKISNSRVSKY